MQIFNYRKHLIMSKTKKKNKNKSESKISIFGSSTIKKAYSNFKKTQEKKKKLKKLN